MVDKITASILGGIGTTLTIIVLLIAYGAISNGLRQIDPKNPVLGQTIDNTNKAVNEGVNSYLTWDDIIGTIELIGVIVGLIVGAVASGVWLWNKFNPPSYF